MTDDDTIYVACTIIPQANTAHVAAFTNEEAAENYVEVSEEKSHDTLPEDALVWIGYDEAELQEEYGGGDS